MQCPTCDQVARKFGKDRDGNQRYQCQNCRKTFSDRPVNPLDEMRLPLDKAIFVLKLLAEGNSIRATTRISGVAKNTLVSLFVCVGQKCEEFLREKLQGVKARDVQCDEIWGFVQMKEKEKAKNKKQIASDEIGDAYCYVAIERTNKLIIAWHLGRRDQFNTFEFIRAVERSTRGYFQMSTDGFRYYPDAVRMVFEGEHRFVDHAAVVKQYGKLEDDSPSTVLDIDVYACCGNPDLDRACTSHIKRQNSTIRMQCQRMTRLTNAFSKKWANHEAALALHFATYNFVTRHGTLTKAAEGVKTTPAMRAGVTDHPWTLEELLIEASRSTH